MVWMSIQNIRYPILAEKTGKKTEKEKTVEMYMEV